MATLLEITNRVLKRLREDTVSNLTSNEYANLIASFVTDIAEEVNERGFWSALDHTVEVEVVPNTSSYSLDNTTEFSELLYSPDGRPQAWIFDDEHDRYGEPMIQLDNYELERRYQLDRDMDIETPYHFALDTDTENSGLILRLWPAPKVSRLIRIRFNTPQPPLNPDEDENTEILLPERVLFLGALYLALNERGEEIGEPGGIAERRYEMALAAARESEIRNRERTGRYDWSRN